jgi:hypothetical protein
MEAAKKRCKICREFVQKGTREEVMQNLQIMFSGSPSAQIVVNGLHNVVSFQKKNLLFIWLQMHKASAKEGKFFSSVLRIIVSNKNCTNKERAKK